MLYVTYFFKCFIVKNYRERINNYPIWSTECPSCKIGIVLLFEKGGLGVCDKCKRTYYTDYEDHPELGTPQTEYWLMD